MAQFRFPKAQRICNKKDIDLLFSNAQSVRQGSIMLRYAFRESHSDEAQQQILIVVPKKRVRSAVNRNKIKRQLREIYRLNKEVLKTADPKGKTLLMACIYTGNEKTGYHELEKHFRQAMEKIILNGIQA